MPARLTPDPPSLSTRYAQIQKTLTPEVNVSSNHEPAEIVPETSPTKNEIEAPDKQKVYLSPGLPESIIKALPLVGVQILAEPQEGYPVINIGPLASTQPIEEEVIWIYTLVAPFFTLTDEISFEALQKLWEGQTPQGSPFSEILVTSSTQSAMITLLGDPNPNSVKLVSNEVLQEKALTDEPFLAIIPFEMSNPQWKILRINGNAPIDPDFDPFEYKLAIRVWVEGQWSGGKVTFPPTNYDPSRRTVLIMTGVTALTRATAFQMATRGETFPGQDIRNWLLAADITHISHEVPFAEDCPTPDPVQGDLIFCAAPERIVLLEDIGADVIELTGNHLLDYGEAAANLTIQMYRDRGWETYAGGLDLVEAQTPAKISHNGNKLVFIGCNLPGPPNVWATASKPGAAACGDYLWLEAAIQGARAEGYLPIVTLQYIEDYSSIPSSQMERDFLRLAEAGAVVVNGSQAHTPKIMNFHQDSFMHFGLGNLFFDQMAVYYQDVLMEGTRDEFLDRLIFYDNRLVSIELMTAKLEDYARPRPMTLDERGVFLKRIFDIALEYQEERQP
mgnify:CR=1 FL=1